MRDPPLIWHHLAQIASATRESGDALPVDFHFRELTLWQRFWFMSSGWLSLFYFAILIWMLIYCVKHDPDRYLWVWIIVLLWPLGPFIYFIARWLPNSQLKLPAFARQWTRKNEIRRLESAALQIGNAHQHIQYGDALKGLGKYAQALESYQQALDREPENLPALWGLASMKFRLNRFAEAQGLLEQVLQMDPAYKFGDVSLLYGKSLFAQNLKTEAKAHLEIHTRKWRQPEAMYLLASLYLEAGESQLAKDTLQSMILDLDASPRAIARKHLFWKGKARKILRKM